MTVSNPFVLKDKAITTAKGSPGFVDSSLIEDKAITTAKGSPGFITNAMVNASAAIAQSKLDLEIKNADISADAAIAFSKLASGPLKYIGSDITTGSIVNSTMGTTIGSVTIPANTVTTGILVFVYGLFRCINSSNSNAQLKIGVTGSETLRKVNEAQTSEAGDAKIPFSIMYYESSQVWTNEISVIVRGINSIANALSQVNCHGILVVGY